MFAKLSLYLPLLFLLCACSPLSEEELPTATPPDWGPDGYRVDAVLTEGQTAYFVQTQDDGSVAYSSVLVPESELPFQFYVLSFNRSREMIISSPYPIRPNWFRVACPDCVDPADTASGIKFIATTAREKDYLLIARLDSAYWECLRGFSPSSEGAGGRLRFSFQVLDTYPVTPTRFTLQGFYNQQQELLQLKARRDASDTWHLTYDYQLFRKPGPKDFSIHISKHPQLGNGQSLLRIGSSMPLVPQSVWIGLAGECLDQADWEVHRNRNANRFLLDVVIPDCYLDCLNNVAEGFEFEVDFFQYAP